MKCTCLDLKCTSHDLKCINLKMINKLYITAMDTCIVCSVFHLLSIFEVNRRRIFV